MSELQEADFISQAQYDQYTADWSEIINGGSTEGLQQVFLAPNGARLNFSTFSIAQIRTLVEAAGAQLIKARFILLPYTSNQARFSVTLCAVDAAGNRLSAHYIPTQATAQAAQGVAALNEPSTQIPRELAMRWLTEWVDVPELQLADFTTDNGPLRGYNFEVSTFKDPLAGAKPYNDKILFLNYGLSADTGTTQATLVVYIAEAGSRTQGNLEGIPEDDAFYDSGVPCPPSPMM